MRTLALLLLALPLTAAVTGTVTNQSSGKPQPGVSVTLFKVGGGMEPVKTVTTDAQGKFSIDATPEGPHLLQAAWQDITYNSMLPPGQPTTGLTLQIFDATKSEQGVDATQHMVLLEPSAENLAVTETLFIVNSGKATYNDPAGGAFRFYLPAATNGDVRITISEPNALIPLQRPAEKTGKPDIYKVNFPIKPGETRFDIAYTLPKSETFQSRVLHKTGATRLVAPKGVTLEGDGIESLGPEPRTQAQIYNVNKPEYAVKITGAGSLRAAEAAPAEEENSGSSIEVIQPPLYDNLYAILGLAFAILAIGFVIMYRRGSPAAERRR
ncbi:MAG: carboxypeptidase-like regulatory domain-containing protein [Bryobacteraceae bacterium]|nr:carboxypeptidase-like regulatory domain-containing protein [Bryobacteraceae bacterium]